MLRSKLIGKLSGEYVESVRVLYKKWQSNVVSKLIRGSSIAPWSDRLRRVCENLSADVRRPASCV